MSGKKKVDGKISSSEKNKISSSKKKKTQTRKSDGETESRNAAKLWVAKKPLDSRGTARKWSESPTSPAGSRLLELADIALGIKKPDSFRKRRSSTLKPKP